METLLCVEEHPSVLAPEGNGWRDLRVNNWPRAQGYEVSASRPVGRSSVNSAFGRSVKIRLLIRAPALMRYSNRLAEARSRSRAGPIRRVSESVPQAFDERTHFRGGAARRGIGNVNLGALRLGADLHYPEGAAVELWADEKLTPFSAFAGLY